MAMFDSAWVARANAVLSDHRTGAVPEFNVTLAVESSTVAMPRVYVVASNGGVRFSTSERRVDCSASADGEVLRQAFDQPDQTDFMDLLLARGDLHISGDMAKAKFFSRGLVRSASPELVRRLRALDRADHRA